MQCANCDATLDWDDPPGEERRQCPSCGSTLRANDLAFSAAIRATATLTGPVERGLDEIRLGVLGIVVTIGLTVGFGADASWWVGVLAGAGSFGLALGAIWWPTSRDLLMEFMHRVTGG
jgi:hypothetical protein